MNHNSTSDIRTLLEQRGIGLKKRFGQNFLVNQQVRERIEAAVAEHCANPAGELWEIGPGLGSLTDLLLERGYVLRLFEIDHGLVAILRERYGDRVPIVAGDVLDTMPSYRDQPPDAIVGNLPYHSASAIVAAIIEEGLAVPRMVFLVQKEMADRMRAPVGSSDYSAFSVLVQLHYQTRKLFDVPGSAFYPRPHVGSSVVVCSRRSDAPEANLQRVVSRLTRQAFSQRRKTLRNTLSDHVDLLEALGIDSGLRAEVLPPEVFREMGTLLIAAE